MSLAKRALELPESNPLRKEILRFLGGNKIDTNLKKATYLGRSKKITSKEVYIVKEGKEKTKIRDLNGNESTVQNTQLSHLV
jgi:hypothetical protein